MIVTVNLHLTDSSVVRRRSVKNRRSWQRKRRRQEIAGATSADAAAITHHGRLWRRGVTLQRMLLRLLQLRLLLQLMMIESGSSVVMSPVNAGGQRRVFLYHVGVVRHGNAAVIVHGVAFPTASATMLRGCGHRGHLRLLQGGEILRQQRNFRCVAF